MIRPTISVDQRQLDAYLKRLDRNRGKPLLTRAENTINAAAIRVIVPAARGEAPVSSTGHYIAGNRIRSGTLRRKVAAKRLRKRGGEDIRPTWVGSRAFYSRFVQQGTRGHSLAPRSGRLTLAAFAPGVVRPFYTTTGPLMHPGSRPNAFMARAEGKGMAEVVALVQRDVFDVR